MPAKHTPSEADRNQRSIVLVGVSRLLGLGAAIVGVVAGIVMAARRHEVTCPDGKYFPEGTDDFRCFSHPQAAEGIAVIAVCIALGALIVICAEIAATGRARPPSAPSGS